MVALSGLRTLGFGGVAPVGLLVLIRFAPQGLVALAGLRALGFGGVAPIGAYSPSRSQQSKEYNLQHKGPRASHPPPKVLHFHPRALRYFLPRCCSMCSQGTTVLLTGTAVFPLKLLQYVLPRHRSSAHEYCGISSQGAAVCASKCTWYVSPPRSFGSSHEIVVFPSKVPRSGYPGVRVCTLPKVAQFLPRRYSMRLQGCAKSRGLQG